MNWIKIIRRILKYSQLPKIRININENRISSTTINSSLINYQVIGGNDMLHKVVNPPINNTNLKFTVDLYAGGGYEINSPEGIAANVYITIANIITKLSEAMNGSVPNHWAISTSLPVFPFAGIGLNAYYNRKRLAFFYYKKPEDGQWFFTSAEADIVAHELGHAILDAIRPDLWDAASLEIWAFHEAFADIVAMLSIMQHDEVLDRILQSTNGDLRKNNLASDIAEAFGEIVAKKENRASNYLRSGINDYNYVDPSFLPKTGTYDSLLREPHSFSRVFFGAIYDIMVMIYENKCRSVDRKTALIEARNVVASYIGRAVSKAPASVKFYESVAKTLLWVDINAGGYWQKGMQEIFSNRKILNLLQAHHAGHDPGVHTQDGLSIVDHSKKDKLCNCSAKIKILGVGDELSYVDLAIKHTDAYIYDPSGDLLYAHCVSEKETIEAVEEMVDYLKLTKNVSNDSDTPFEIQDGKLKRSSICCCN